MRLSRGHDRPLRSRRVSQAFPALAPPIRWDVDARGSFSTTNHTNHTNNESSVILSYSCHSRDSWFPSRRFFMHLWFLRACFFALLIGMATGVLVYLENQSQNILGMVVFGIMLLLGIAVVSMDLFVPNKQITTLSAIYFGLLLGLLIGSLFST